MSILLSCFQKGLLPYLERDIQDCLGKDEKISTRFLERYQHGILDFIAYDQKKPLGIITIKKRDFKNRHTQMVINVVREESWTNNSLQNRLRAVLYHLFKDLHFHKVSVLVAEPDQTLLQFLKECGFVEEGLLRHHFIFCKQICSAHILTIFEGHYS